jgi:3-oxoacyl-[acyl-carrier-protein] synthase II
MKKRVVITGLGIVSAVGNNLSGFWNSLIEGKDGTKKVTVFDSTPYRIKIAAEVSGLNPEDHFTKKEVRRLSRCDQFGLVAFREAWSSARFNQDPVVKSRVGVILGAGSGGILSVERYFRDFYQGLKKLSPSLLISYSLATTTDHIALEASLKGPRSTTATVCSSSSVSLGVAYEMIQMGQADVMVSGGSDSLCEVSFSGFSSLKLVDSESCKPFDKRRQGLVIGEGAGILILEELEHAMKRNAPILAEFLGYWPTRGCHPRRWIRSMPTAQPPRLTILPRPGESKGYLARRRKRSPSVGSSRWSDTAWAPRAALKPWQQF